MTTEMEIAKQKRKAARELPYGKVQGLKDIGRDIPQLTSKEAGITHAEYEKEYKIAQDYYENLSTFKIKVKKAIASAGNESSSSPNPNWRPADGAHAATKAK
ncbi:hypothetical protein NPIL_659121 [Nephila pilipes]|uniref:Uncharacterized protein n=1 Tax=Nephila pilipes TaxID=299642 RepID=A0A8X6NKR5_NEPPI|nr:hypothetical protein NPIL_659121 [Nephila pilipes]